MQWTQRIQEERAQRVEWQWSSDWQVTKVHRLIAGYSAAIPMRCFYPDTPKRGQLGHLSRTCFFTGVT
jgi:hypothetical protein